MSIEDKMIAKEKNESQASFRIKLQIAGFVFLTFLGYMCIGLPLAVLPIYIHKNLGYSELITGIIISTQYITTFLMRGYSGIIIDNQGPKLAVKISMAAFTIGGLLLYIAFHLHETPWLSLSVLTFSRLIIGCAEGLIGASPINWAMLSVGDKHTATAISFSGIASYGALAIGAPLGVICVELMSRQTMAMITIFIGIFGLFYALQKKAKTNTVDKEKDTPLPFFKVFRMITPLGLCLCLSGIGFGGLSNFITLYYDYFNWRNAAFCLTSFSFLFVFGRLFFAKRIDQYGGIIIGMICIAMEVIGLLILFWADNTTMALIGSAITGLGFSAVFPALGVEAIHRAPASNSGVALAGYGLFIDISLGITGPLLGSVIHLFGMPYIYFFCALASVFGLGLAEAIRRKKI